MNLDKSRARVQQGPRHPPGFPLGVVVPTGPRASNPVRRPPPGPIKLGNRQIPNVPSPVSLTKITYEEALEEILKQTGPYPMRFTTLPSIQTSIVLYDPRGEVVKAGEGLLLKEDVSLCYLITWLQIFTDNYRAKYNPGVELVIRSVEFRFRDKLAYMSYPNLEGGLSYYNDNGMATACVNWPCGNSLMEQYWEAFRSMMQLGGDDQIKYPIIKIRTVKYLAGDPYGIETKKRLGGGHVFVINEENLDVHRYFNRQGQQIPESLIQLDQWLTESENRHLSQDTVEESQTHTGGPGDQMQPQGELIKPTGASSSLPRGQTQIGKFDQKIYTIKFSR
jgi:hypothetical protein